MARRPAKRQAAPTSKSGSMTTRTADRASGGGVQAKRVLTTDDRMSVPRCRTTHWRQSDEAANRSTFSSMRLSGMVLHRGIGSTTPPWTGASAPERAWSARDFNRCAHCGHMHHSLIESGLLAVPATDMRVVLDAAPSKHVTVVSAMRRAWHLRCLVGTALPRPNSSGPRSANSVDDLVAFLDGHTEPSETVSRYTGLRRPRQDNPVADEPRRRRIPQEIRGLQENDTPDDAVVQYASERGLMGLLVVGLG